MPRTPSYLHQAAKRGVFAFVVLDGDDSGELETALDITLRRSAEFRNLKGAFGRRATIEQAKGISWSETASTPKPRLPCSSRTHKKAARSSST
jgi:AmiR/NasT family two-component response regulator